MSVRRLICELDLEMVNVSEFCAAHGVSRSQFYAIRRRFGAVGPAAFEPGSRVPARIANRTPGLVEDAIVTKRKELDDAGLDAGAETIRWHLQRSGLEGVPTGSTIWRVLTRRGFIVPDPSKAPKSVRSFQADRPNEVWQIDGTNFKLADGTLAKIINIIDDRSRVCIASHAAASESVEAVWAATSRGAAQWGLPERFLSDNGTAFRAVEKDFAGMGVAFGHSKPYHPQTCGKVERFQQTLKKWLTKQKPPNTHRQLQRLIDEFGLIYNYQRPHRSLDRQTPADVWNHTPKAGPTNRPLHHGPTRIARKTTGPNGILNVFGLSISLGRAHKHQDATLIITGTTAQVITNGTIIRTIEINPTDHVYPIHKTPGKPKCVR